MGNHGKRRPRLREAGIVIGGMPTGENNAITDVIGVKVGHVTLINDGADALPPGSGPARTGVTVVLPHGGDLYRRKVRAAVHTINGHGKVFGFEEVRELGVIESPIALTNTFNVGRVVDALVEYVIEENRDIGTTTGHLSLNVIVGETNDGFLNDMQGRHVRRDHVFEAIERARRSADRAPVDEGNVGAGTGTHTFGWKGGIGTASRVLPGKAGGFTVGALVQSNFGLPEQLMISGVPIGARLVPDAVDERSSGGSEAQDEGSIMIILATDAPLSQRQLIRMSKRAVIGLARTGGHMGHQSGEFVISFSTGNPVHHRTRESAEEEVLRIPDGVVMPGLFQGVVEAVEEAVLNALFKAQTLAGRAGNVRIALPLDRVLAIIGESS